MLIYILTAFVAVNSIGLILVAADKHKAVKKRWRIPEKWFFIVSLIGGCPGVYSGLLLFRHKTRHWYFMWGIPAIFALQLLLIYYLISSGLLSITLIP